MDKPTEKGLSAVLGVVLMTSDVFVHKLIM
jgi:hypothetical protein